MNEQGDSNKHVRVLVSNGTTIAAIAVRSFMLVVVVVDLQCSIREKLKEE